MAQISKIRVLESLYEIVDADAIHDATELADDFDAKGAAATAKTEAIATAAIDATNKANAAETAAKAYADGLLSSVLTFKGTKASEAEVKAIASAKVGDVWLTSDEHREWVAIRDISAADATAWEVLGFDVNAASSTHVHNVTVTGSNSTSSVTGQVPVNTYSGAEKYLTANISNIAISASETANVVTGYDGATSKMVTDSILGVQSTTTEASKITEVTAITVPNVTNPGTASTWSFAVTDDVLTINGANGNAAQLGTAISVSQYTFASVDVPVKAASTKTFATGALAANGAGDTVMTGLGTKNSATVPTRVQVTTQPTVSLGSATSASTGAVKYIDGLTSGTENKNIANGVAAAQTWTQSTGYTGAPID